MKRRIMLLAVVTMVLCGCASSPPRRLSKEQVIQAAERVGIEHGLDPKCYTAPYLCFRIHDRTWYASFSPKKAYQNRSPWAGGFGVEVNDQTGSTRYDEHIFK